MNSLTSTGNPDAGRLRPLRVDDDRDVRAWSNLVGRVFQQSRIDDAELARRRERLRTERVGVAEEDGALVAAFRSFDTTLSVPAESGALVDANAISGVVVSATHKRKGLLTEWITRDLHDAKDRGSVASVLYASETTIYGRFGFGVATAAASWTLQVPLTRFRRPATGRLVVLEPDDVRTVAEQIYSAAQRRCIGSIGRREFSWLVFLGRAGATENASGRWYVVHLDDAGTPDGVVSYTMSDDWQHGVSNSRLEIQDLFAANENAEQALWQHCASVDFVQRVELHQGSPGQPLPHWLIDPRAAVAGRPWDGIWARIHDVPTALSARNYPFAGQLRIQVHDALGHAAGTFALESDENGTATCTTTSGEPDLTIGVADLGSLWLGGDVGVPRLAEMDVDLGGRRSPAWVHAFFSAPTAPHSLTHF